MAEQKVKLDRPSSRDSRSEIGDEPDKLPTQLTQLASRLAVSSGESVETQARQLGDSRLSSMQRQTLAAQIGRVQGNRHLQRVIAARGSKKTSFVQRDTAGGGPSVGGKFTVESPERKLVEFGKESYIKGDVKAKIEGTGEVVETGQSPAVSAGGTSNVGAKVDINLAKQKGFEILDTITVKEFKEKMSFELSKKKLDISVGVEAPIATKYPWLTGVAELKFTFVSVDWEKMKKNPDDVTVAALKLTGGVAGEGKIPLDESYEIKLKAKITITGTAKPNLERIAIEAGKQIAEGAAEGGGEAVVGGEAAAAAAGAGEAAAGAVAVDLAAVASAAAAIALPLAVGVAIGFGMFQEAKNIGASRAAIAAGLTAREEARRVAKSFASTLTGSSGGGGRGNAEAEAQITSIMTKTHATREQVIEAIRSSQGGYGALYQKTLKQIKDHLYSETVRIWEETHQQEFGLIEKIGEGWGMRGVFRKDLSIVLYGGDDS